MTHKSNSCLNWEQYLARATLLCSACSVICVKLLIHGRMSKADCVYRCAQVPVKKTCHCLLCDICQYVCKRIPSVYVNCVCVFVFV